MYSRGKASEIDAGLQRQMTLHVYLNYSSFCFIFPSLSTPANSDLFFGAIHLNFDRIPSSFCQDALL